LESSSEDEKLDSGIPMVSTTELNLASDTFYVIFRILPGVKVEFHSTPTQVVMEYTHTWTDEETRSIMEHLGLNKSKLSNYFQEHNLDKQKYTHVIPAPENHQILTRTPTVEKLGENIRMISFPMVSNFEQRNHSEKVFID
jgi:hypothetical protein